MWYFVWIIAVLLALATGLLAVMWVDVRSRAATQTAHSQGSEPLVTSHQTTGLAELTPRAGRPG